MQYKGRTNDGVRLIKTYIIDNVLTCFFPTMSRYQEIREILDNIHYLKNKKQILDSYHIFQGGNVADSKKKVGLNLKRIRNMTYTTNLYPSTKWQMQM